MSIKLYGVPGSQPTRAVAWLCSMKNLEYVFINVLSAKISKKELKKLNPRVAIPVITDTDDNFTVYESPAIMTYLCSKYGWNDLYPTNNLKRRTLIDQYLNWHHENTRKVTTGYLRVIFRPKYQKLFMNNNADLTPIKMEIKIAKRALNIIDNYWLSKHDYIIDNKVSIADILCYAELIQIKAFPYLFKNIDLQNKYINIKKWMNRMSKLNKHDEIHEYVFNTMPPFMRKRANDCKQILSKL
eukprot:418592_1